MRKSKKGKLLVAIAVFVLLAALCTLTVWSTSEQRNNTLPAGDYINNKTNTTVEQTTCTTEVVETTTALTTKAAVSDTTVKATNTNVAKTSKPKTNVSAKQQKSTAVREKQIRNIYVTASGSKMSDEKVSYLMSIIEGLPNNFFTWNVKYIKVVDSIVIYKDSTSDKLVRICSYKGGNALPENSLEWLASLIVGVIIADNKMALLTDFITAAKNEVDKTAPDKAGTTKAYFKLVETFFEKIMDVDERVMFTSDLNTITKEYAQNTTDFDDCKAIFSMQSYFLQEPDAQYFTFIVCSDYKRKSCPLYENRDIAKRCAEDGFMEEQIRKIEKTRGK